LEGDVRNLVDECGGRVAVEDVDDIDVDDEFFF